MGCWDEFDAITHTPIFEDNPVVMVVLTQNHFNIDWWTRTFLQIPKLVSGIYKGTYNNYGWIKETPFCEKTRPDRYSVFFHIDTWNAVLEKYGPCKDSILDDPFLWEDEKVPEYLDELFAIMNFASSCRLHLGGGLLYKGGQFNYRECRLDYDFLLGLRADSFDRMDNHFKQSGRTET